jgi:hypothetical protein
MYLLLISAGLYAQNVIDISVKGISDQRNDGAQQDRLEAIVDAKKQACEKAGLRIEAKTTVENFKLVQDLVESQAATVLLPGFQLIDVGYVQDGTYQVVLSGKIKILEEEEKISTKEMRYAKSLNDRGKYSDCETILRKYIDSEDQNVSEELKEEAFYYFIKWGYSWDVDEQVNKFAAYYPDSKHVSNLQAFAAFALRPLHGHDQAFNSDARQWQEVEFINDDIKYTQKIGFKTDTLIFKNFKGQEQTLLVNFTLFSDQESEPNTAFRLVISYYDGNIGRILNATEVKTVLNEVQTFRSGRTTTFSSSYSGKVFSDYKLKSLQITGDVPAGKGPFQQKLRFDMYQISF